MARIFRPRTTGWTQFSDNGQGVGARVTVELSVVTKFSGLLVKFRDPEEAVGDDFLNIAKS